MDTQQTPRLNLLGDTSATSDSSDSSGGCCGGGGACACGNGAADTGAAGMGTETSSAVMAPTITGAPESAGGGISNAGGSSSGGSSISNGTTLASTTQEFLVTGMTCGHCVSSVKEEVGALDGIASVEVILKKGGASRVTVSATSEVDESAVRSAVEEAGYQLA